MWIPFSTPSTVRSRPNRRIAVVATGLVAVSLLAAAPVRAQVAVYDPTNHIENALQAARQLESLANEARSLAASPYSHLAQNSRSLQDMAELARTVRGLTASVGGLEQQFQSLYPDDLAGTDVLRLLEQGRARTATARHTAADLARTAAELERLGADRQTRLTGALGASDAAAGQTAAIQSSNQMLAVLAEDLAAMRTILLAQSRLMAEATARDAADRTSGDEARRQRWARPGSAPATPDFDPFSRARD
jgi:P-type conjugative transfer protein TrbJ